MSKQKPRAIVKGFIILALSIFVGLLPRPSLAKDKRGAMLTLERKEGRVIKGELLSVEGSMLVILNYENLAKTNENIEELNSIFIEKKSGFLKGIGLGLLIGGGGGAILGLLSGDDEEGFFRFSAGQKGLAGGIGFGLLGGLAGGIFGALSSTNESIDLQALSVGEKKQVLKKLATKARFSTETLADLKTHLENKELTSTKAVETTTGQTPMPIGIGVQENKQSAKQKHSRIHFSLIPGYFTSNGIQTFKNIIEKAGFAMGESYGAGFFSSTGGTIDYPWVTKDPTFYIKDIRIEYSITYTISLGLSYSPLGQHRVTGRTVIPGKDYRSGFEVESYLNGKYSGNAYFVTVSYMPLPDAFLKKLAIKLGLGAGYCKMNGSLMTSLYSIWSEADGNDPSLRTDRIDFSGHGLCFMVLGEIDYFFNRSWSLGINVDYKYAPGLTPSFQLKAPFWYYPASPYYGGEMTYGSLVVQGPSYKFNGGGLGIGLNFGVHF